MKIFQITGSGYLNIKEKMRVLIYEDLKKFQRMDDRKEAVNPLDMTSFTIANM